MIILYEEKDNGFVGIHFDEDLNAWVMHMDCKNWSPQTFKRYLKIWKTIIIPALKKRNIKEVYGLCENIKAVKFNSLFGVRPIGQLVTTSDGMVQVLTKGVF